MLSAALVAQETQIITTGPGYQAQSYFRLSDGEEETVSNSAWDIAFSIYGTDDAGVFINESSGSSMGQPQPVIQLFQALTLEFNEVPDSVFILDYPLLNPEDNWATGAFNTLRNPDNPDDRGWGLFNPATQAVEGDMIYVVKLRNGQFRKLQVQSLAGGVYTFRYARLNGADEVTVTIDKADFPGQTLAYYNLTTHAVADVEPDNGFDLLYCRYIALILNPGTGGYEPYQVTGILSGLGVEVAKADGVDPETVDYADWADSLSTRLDVVGHDWKAFSGSGWALDPDRVYFVRTADDHVWKLHFTAFGGSTNGTATFEKTDLGIILSADDPDMPGLKTLLYPNPAGDVVYVVLDNTNGTAPQGHLVICDITGRIIHSQRVEGVEGLRAITVPSTNWLPGLYRVAWQYDGGVVGLGTVSKL
jgi:hypothetical protein